MSVLTPVPRVPEIELRLIAFLSSNTRAIHAIVRPTEGDTIFKIPLNPSIRQLEPTQAEQLTELVRRRAESTGLPLKTVEYSQTENSVRVIVDQVLQKPGREPQEEAIEAAQKSIVQAIFGQMSAPAKGA